MSWLETLITRDYDFMSNAVKNYFRPAEGIFGADWPHTLFNLFVLTGPCVCLYGNTQAALFLGGGADVHVREMC